MKGTYLNESLRGQIHSLANDVAVLLLGLLGLGGTSWVVAEGSRVAHGASRSAYIARRTAAATNVGASVLRSSLV